MECNNKTLHADLAVCYCLTRYEEDLNTTVVEACAYTNAIITLEILHTTTLVTMNVIERLELVSCVEGVRLGMLHLCIHMNWIV